MVPGAWCCVDGVATLMRSSLTHAHTRRRSSFLSQAGAWQPFFRAHAHIETKRREPWLFGAEVLARIRKSVATRYSYLPFWCVVPPPHSSPTGSPGLRRAFRCKGAPADWCMWLYARQVHDVLREPPDWHAGHAADVGGVP